ncbi:cuticle-degrading protease [Ceratobasidium sp. AG-Ba]|nr:cuticle-degrading protease [Ceratobasidium sp. AG-Ba]
MRAAFFTCAALAVILPALGVPTNVPITKHAGSVKADSYIVKLKDGVSKESHLSAISSGFVAGSGVEYTYDNVFMATQSTSRAKISISCVRAKMSNIFLRTASHLLNISSWKIYFLSGLADMLKPQTSPGDEPAVAERSEPTVNRLNARANGSGVVVYGIDTGIYTAHSTFGGRASWGATFGGYANADGNGHGTRESRSRYALFIVTDDVLKDTAGTAVGTTYGVATSARIVAIKVLSDAGSGAYSDIIAGVNWVVSNKGSSPAVATMSLGGSANSALDSAISSAISQGVHFSIAAGNSNVDAANTSPARVAAANTVGAVDSSNRKASFSNYGSILDVWALGVNVLSAWIGSTTATNTISGTSMATPRVAGYLAVALGDYGSVTPASLSASLKSHAAAVVTGAPSGTTNLLAQRW